MLRRIGGAKGWGLRKVHDLEVLVNEATTYRREIGQYAKVCRKISGYYIAECYPMVDSLSITREDVSHSRDEVKGLVEFIRRELR